MLQSLIQNDEGLKKEDISQIILLNKSSGQTPLEALEEYRQSHLEYMGVPMTYAGRLDPLASGLLIILAGDAVYKKETYLALDKEYEVEICIGASTDTYDILGLVTEESFVCASEGRDLENPVAWTELIKKYIGPHDQSYPPYSSKPVLGKPLFMHAREGSLAGLNIPTKEIEIYTIDFLGEYILSQKTLQSYIHTSINAVRGDFRQRDIEKRWNDFFEARKQKQTYHIVKLRVSCSSGTYIRSLVARMGQDLGIPLCLYSLKRTRVGTFTINT